MNSIHTAALAAAIALGAGLSAQDDPELVALRDEKLASPFLKKVAWFTDFDAACEVAQAEGKPIFAYFTRSFSP